MLTGSQTDSSADTDNKYDACNNWTSTKAGDGSIPGNTGPAAQIGRSDRNGVGNGSWNSSHPTRACSQEDITFSDGVGRFHCFAVN